MNSVINTARETADHAVDAVRDTGGSMKGSLLDLGTQILRLYNQAHVAEIRGVDGVLHHIGLQRRSSALVPALWFAAGAVVAGGFVLALTPTTGRELRRKLGALITGDVAPTKVVVKQAKPIEVPIEPATSPTKAQVENELRDGHLHTS